MISFVLRYAGLCFLVALTAIVLGKCCPDTLGLVLSLTVGLASALWVMTWNLPGERKQL